MDKRTFQALLVCFAISILYMNLFMAPPEQGPGGNEPVTIPTGTTEQVAGDLQGSEAAGNVPPQGSGATQGNTDSTTTLSVPVQPPAEVKTVSLTNGMLDLVLSSRGALLTEVRLCVSIRVIFGEFLILFSRILPKLSLASSRISSEG